MTAKKTSVAKKFVARKPVGKKGGDRRAKTKSVARKSVSNRSVGYGKTDIRYLSHLPREPIAAGRFLVHNRVKPVSELGLNGFRAWTQNDDSRLVKCRCRFGGCANAKFHTHYRIEPRNAEG
jgi:hypothetical protein